MFKTSGPLAFLHALNSESFCAVRNAARCAAGDRKSLCCPCATHAVCAQEEFTQRKPAEGAESSDVIDVRRVIESTCHTFVAGRGLLKHDSAERHAAQRVIERHCAVHVQHMQSVRKKSLHSGSQQRVLSHLMSSMCYG